MATNRDIIFVLKLRNEASAGIRSIAAELRRLQGSLQPQRTPGTAPRTPGVVPRTPSVPTSPRSPGSTPIVPAGQVREATGAVQGLMNALKGLGALYVATETIKMADAYTVLTNRIKLVTKSEAEANVIRQKVLDIANRTRQDIGATAELYARFAAAGGDLGMSQNRVLTLTETIGKAMAISGVSTEAANAALVQLAQGMSSGVLRGEELNSVLEQAPRLAKAIADGMGITVGQLRNVGHEGKITADVLVKALESQRAKLDAEFAKMTMTAGQGFTVLMNGVKTFVGSFNEASGAAGGLGAVMARVGLILSDPKVIQAVAQLGNTLADMLMTAGEALSGLVQLVANAVEGIRAAAQGTMFEGFVNEITTLDGLLKRFTAYAIAAAGVFSAMWVGGMIAAAGATGILSAALGVLAGALAATGIGVIIIILGEAIYQFMQLAEKVGGAGTAFSLLAAVVMEAFSRMGMIIDIYQAKFMAMWENMKAAVFDWVAGALVPITDWADSAIGLFVGAYEAVIAAWNNFGPAMKDLGAMAMNGLIEVVESGIKGIMGAIQSLFDFIGGGFEAVGMDNPFAGMFDPNMIDLSEWKATVTGAAANTATEAIDAFNGAMERSYVSGPDVGGFTASAEAARNAAVGYGEAVSILERGAYAPMQSIGALNSAIAANGQAATNATQPVIDLNAALGTPGAGTGAGAGGGTSGAAKAAKEGMDLLKRAIEDHTPRAVKLREDYMKLKAALDQFGASLTPAELAAVNRELERLHNLSDGGILGGLREGFASYTESMRTMAEEVSDWVGSTMDSLASTLTDFFLTGKAGFKDFAASAIKSLMEIMVKQWLLAPIAGFLGLKLPVGHTGAIVGGDGWGQSVRSVRSLPKFHTGGISSGEQMAVVRKNEAIMPTTRLSDGTLGIRAEGGAGGSITNQINVTVDGNGASATPAQREEYGNQIAKQIQAALQLEMGKFAQREMRPGGMFYKGGY